MAHLWRLEAQAPSGVVWSASGRVSSGLGTLLCVSGRTGGWSERVGNGLGALLGVSGVLEELI